MEIVVILTIRNQSSPNRRSRFVDTVLHDLWRGGSSNDAEITERVRIRPMLIEWELNVPRGGGNASSSKGNSPMLVRCGDHTVSLFVAAH